MKNKIIVINGKENRSVISANYMYTFNKVTGHFARWGKTHEDDPAFAPFPEIADVEISTICNGIGKLDNDGNEIPNTAHPCPFCYKSNTGKGSNMSLETFKKVFAHLNQHKTLTQIAFGIGDINGNPELFDILYYTRRSDVVPNITVNGWGISTEIAEKLAKVCGAVSVSHYNDDVCFNAVKKLTDFIGKPGTTLNAVNIHQLLSMETYNECLDIINKIKTDERLKNMGSVVFLSLKPKGDRNHFNCIDSMEKYHKLFNKAMDEGIGFGSDSCGAKHVMESFKDHENYEQIKTSVEGCESTCFSIYVNTEAKVFPCSFAEGVGEWKDGINLLEVEDFKKEVWHNEKIIKFREANIKKCDSCLIYKI